MADRRYKLLGSGLPGPSSFGVGDLLAGSTPQWNLTTEAWDAVVLGDTYYTETEVDTLFTDFQPTKLFFSGVQRVGTHLYGLVMRGDDSDVIQQMQFTNAAGGDTGNISVHPSSGMYMYSYQHGLPMYLIGEDAGGTARTIVTGDPDGGVQLNYAGTRNLLGQQTSVLIYSTTDDSPFISLYGSDLARNGYWQAGAGSMRLANEVHGTPIILQAEDVAGTVQSLFYGDPDNNAYMYYNGAICLWTFSAGAVVQHPTGDGPSIYMYRNTGVRNAFIIADSGAFYLRGETHGLPVKLSGEDAGGTVREIINGDPDNFTDIYAAGYLGIRVGNATIGFFNNSGNAKQTITGSRGGNAALTSLLAALANHGLITNSTT